MPQEINVILVEPSGPINIGSVARLCENFGVHQLRLVAPRCNHNNQESKMMAVKGKEVLAKAEIFLPLKSEEAFVQLDKLAS